MEFNMMLYFIFLFLEYFYLVFFQLHVRLLDVMSKLGLQKGSVSRHMSKVIQPILEKGIVDHSILHRVLLEYFSIADKVPLFLSCNSSLWFLLQLRNLVMAIAFSYLNWVFSKTSVAEIIQQLSSPLLIRMIGTKDGAKIGILCVKYGNAKVCLATIILNWNVWSIHDDRIWHIIHSTSHSLFRKERRLSKDWKGI